MDFNGVMLSVAILGGVGVFVGIFLGIATKVFKVDVDKRLEEVVNALPGNNCGGCGYPGCEGLANAIVKGEAPVNQCPVGGAKVAKVIAGIMGEEVTESVKKVAFVACKATCDEASKDYNYYGIDDCRMLSFVPNGGPKSCNNGCLGFGSCVKACEFDAIHVVDGVAVVDREKCKACGKCVAACPKNLISLVPYTAKYQVACSNKEKGPVTMAQCKVGCIGCSLCVRNCEAKAVTVKDFNATIDPELCVNCGTCFEKCPKKSIVKL